MKRIWKVLGTIGSFLTGYILGTTLIASILPNVTNEREIIISFSVLMGLIVSSWWYKTTAPIK